MTAAPPDAELGAALYRLLAAEDGNLVFSPASIAAALRMALAGARGQTAAEIAVALRLIAPVRAAQPGPAEPDWPQVAAAGLRVLSAGLAGVPGDRVTFRAPNTMWVQAGLPLLPAFTAVLREAAAVSVRDADFAAAPEPARREINELVAKQTEDKITDLLPDGTIDRLTRLVLVNAIYLKAAWAHPFPEQATADGPFYSDGAPLTAPMMRLVTELRYLRGDGYQLVVLPYAGGRLAMTIVLPDGPLAGLPGGVVAGLAGLAGQARLHRVTLTMPKFRKESAFSVIPPLRALGMRLAFSREADFSGITAAEDLHISAVRHKAFIDVAEWGTEAAAATAVVVRTSARLPAPAVTMTVDHPFLFAITDGGTGLPLFLGQVSRPG